MGTCYDRNGANRFIINFFFILYKMSYATINIMLSTIKRIFLSRRTINEDIFYFTSNGTYGTNTKADFFGLTTKVVHKQATPYWYSDPFWIWPQILKRYSSVTRCRVNICICETIYHTGEGDFILIGTWISVIVHRGTLLLVPQWQCISSFVFYILFSLALKLI